MTFGYIISPVSPSSTYEETALCCGIITIIALKMFTGEFLKNRFLQINLDLSVMNKTILT